MRRILNKIKKVFRQIYLYLFIHKFPYFFRISSFPYLSGDTLRKLSDHRFDETKSMDPEKVKTNDFVFVKSDRLEFYFKNIHNNISYPYNLISHNSDVNINEETALKADGKILKWYAQNLVVPETNNIKIIPIGLENKRFLNNGLISHFTSYQNTKKSDYILSSFNKRNSERINLDNLVQRNEIITSKIFKDHKDYIKNLSKFKFNLCPKGNGVDTHRLWESFMVDTIPIVKNHIYIENLIKNEIPLFVVNEWEEIMNVDKNELDAIYEKLIYKKKKINLNNVDYWIRGLI